MIDEGDEHNERGRAALMILSTSGAAVAGVGVGALFSRALLPLAWVMVVVGLVAHLLAMVGLRRRLSLVGYRPPLWQQFTYWLCWAAIVASLLYVIWDATR